MKADDCPTPLPLRLRQTIDLLPMHGWQVKPAAITAGYSPSYAERLASLLKHNVRFCQAVEAKRREFMEATGWSIEKWKQECVFRFEHCTQPRSDEDPNSMAVDETNGKGYLELLGRHIGAFAEDNRQRADKIAIVLR